MASGFDLLNAGASVAGLRVERDVAYGAHPRQRLDFYRPAGRGPHPVAVWFYGGSWMTGRRRDYRFVAAALAARGIACAVPDYRLHPEAPFPLFVEDAARAVGLVVQQAGAWGCDPARVVAAGHSAGAYIAVMLALAARFGVREALAGAVGIAGPYDFLPIRDPDIQPIFAGAPDPRDAQPIHHVDGRAPKLLLLHGAWDRVCYPRNSVALATRIRSMGGKVMLRTYPFAGHIGILLGFATLTRWRSPVLSDVQRFMDATAAPALQAAA